MTKTEIEKAITQLPAADVDRPDRPMAHFLQQTNDLATYLKQNEAVTTKLTQVGITKAQLDALPHAIDVAREAESSWQATRKPRTPDEREALEKNAYDLRSDLVAACRWSLRKDKNAQAVLDEVQTGTGAEDLALDLDTLSTLMLTHEQSFDGDATFKVKDQAATAADTAKQVRSTLSEERADESEAKALDMRDRAFTYLDALWDDLRAAGRYAFRDDDAVLAHFRDRYAIAYNRRARDRQQRAIGLPSV